MNDVIGIFFVKLHLSELYNICRCRTLKSFINTETDKTNICSLLKRTALPALFFFVSGQMAYSSPASPVVFSVSQPDGTRIDLQSKGDEYCHWLETRNGQVVVKNGDCYEYAMISDNKLMSSGVLVSNESDSSVLYKGNRSDFLDFFARERKDVLSRMNDAANQSEVIETTSNQKSVSSNSSLTIGNQKVLCILMEFPDRAFSKSLTDFENMWNQTGYNVAGSQGSINDFYNENSYGQMNVTATVVGPYTAQHNSSYYATGDDISNSNVRELVREALNAAKNHILFKDFDVNGDKYVDAVHVVFAGYASDASITNGLIWSHHWSLQTPVTQNLFYKAQEYFITSELAGGSGTTIAPIGTVCHEYGHQLGAPDYYNNYYTGTGEWDVMGNGSWNGPVYNRGRCPSHHNPYTKAYIYNWSSPTIINASTSNTQYSLAPSYNSPTIYRINTSTNGEFFLLENKYAASNTFNSSVPPPGGLILYHVHSDIQNAVDSNDVNKTHPQKCYIVCANATSNPNNLPSSYGTLGIECAYPYNDKMFFTASSTPSATSWDGMATGVDLCYLRRNGNSIKFTVNPKINGSNTLYTTSSYYTYVPPTAHIKWTYTFTPNPPVSPSLLIFNKPIIFVNGDSTASVTIQRGQYPMILNSSTVWIPYTGTAVLKATITSGSYSYIITKTISLGASNNTIEELEYYNAVDSLWEIEENEKHVDTSDLRQSTNEYRLLCENPIMNSATIQIERLSGNDYIPIDRDYILSIYGDKVGLVRHVTGSQPIIHFKSDALPVGFYQIILQVDGKSVAFIRIIKM